MSLLHTIIFRILMKNRRDYVPGGTKDYEAARRAEISTAAFVRIPKGVSVRREPLGGDLFMPGCKADFKNMMKGLADGTLTRKQLQINATRIYRMAKALTAPTAES